MDDAKYEVELKKLQTQLNLLQHTYAREGHRAILVLEGWDAAGKGGLIRRLSWCLDPRHFYVWSINAPDEREKRQHWMQRFWEKLPESGTIAAFDRSWYGRILVERVEGFASEAEWMRAYQEITTFEQSLSAENYRIAKLFLDISKETQLKRFHRRFKDPSKRWKLTEEDLRNRAQWDHYERAYEDMLNHCTHESAPWIRLDANDKRKVRLAALRSILDIFGHGIDTTVPEAPDAVKAFFNET